MGQEGSWLGLCITLRLGIKEGPAGWEEVDLGTMETQRDSTSLQRWSLLLLLLGLVVTPATSRTLSYREAVLRVVDSLNQRSSDENLYRLLKLNSEPQGVSRGGWQWEGRSALASQDVRAVLSFVHALLMSRRLFSKCGPTSSRKPSQSCVLPPNPPSPPA